LHARRLARAHGWWEHAIGAMQGLHSLYRHMGRHLEWARLVNELTPDLVDPATNGPLAGRELEWSFFSAYRVRLARADRDWATAERLQRMLVKWSRETAAAALATAPANLSEEQHNIIRGASTALLELGNILREQLRVECVEVYKECLELDQRIQDNASVAITSLQLGNAYDEIPEIHDLDAAQYWYQRSLDLRDEGDRRGRATSISMLGYIHRMRFKESQAADRPIAEQERHLKAAADAYHQTLELLPQGAINELAITHNQLGNIYDSAGQVDTARKHYQESVRHKEESGDRFGAGQTRYNVAAMLVDDGRYRDALLWAQAALRDFQSYDDRAAAEVARTQEMIVIIDRLNAGGQR
jgi:tetratricopeptide (TPR) repeat protein